MIETADLPEDFVLPDYVYADKQYLNNELYFFTPSSIGYTCAYDTNGDVRWYLNQTAIWEIKRLENGHLLLSSDRLINQPYYMTGLYEMDMLGKVYKEYRMPGGYHHDYFELENNNLLVLSNNFDNGTGTVEDIIVEIEYLTGNIIREIDLKDILEIDATKNEDWTETD